MLNLLINLVSIIFLFSFHHVIYIVIKLMQTSFQIIWLYNFLFYFSSYNLVLVFLELSIDFCLIFYDVLSQLALQKSNFWKLGFQIFLSFLVFVNHYRNSIAFLGFSLSTSLLLLFHWHVDKSVDIVFLT